MLNFILLMGICNVLGGRFTDIWGDKLPIRGAFIFRCIMPGIAAGAYAYSIGYGWPSIYAGIAVTIGSAFWFPFGWGFDEITGSNDPKKYPRWIRWIGAQIFPMDNKSKTNKKRGMVMKGIRGSYDIFTFSLLSYFNSWAIAFWLGTFAMGAVYYLASKISPGMKQDVLVSEFFYGCWRALLIGMTLYL